MQAKKLCVKCKFMVDVLSWNKGCCNSCNSKRALCSQMFGKWPIDPFSSMHDDLQTGFWRSHTKSKQSIHNQLVQDISIVREEIEKEKVFGRYLPESVILGLNYSADAMANIKVNNKSRWDNELGEDTYLLNQKEVVEEKVRREVANMLLSMRDNTLRGKLSHLASPPAKQQKRKRDCSGSSSASEKKKKKKKRSKSSSSSKSSSKSSSSEKDEVEKAASKKLKDAADKKAAAAKAKAAKMSAAALKKTEKLRPFALPKRRPRRRGSSKRKPPPRTRWIIPPPHA
jgi:hypothetical protein